MTELGNERKDVVEALIQIRDAIMDMAWELKKEGWEKEGRERNRERKKAMIK